MPLITAVVFVLCTFMLNDVVETRPQFFSSFEEKTLSPTVKTDWPIIGILAQTTRGHVETFGRTYIGASYVKYIESAGGRVVPIRNNMTEDQLENLFNSINGVLLPGGAVSIYDSPYERTGKTLFNLAKQANDAGDIFPIWGTCLGFELLCQLVANDKHVMSSVDGVDFSVPLNFSEGYKSSRLFRSAPDEIITYLKTKDVTYNHHHYGLTTETYSRDKNLNKFYSCLSTNRGKKGKQFVSTIEAYNYPIFGVQWHPEKNAFEWFPKVAINHSKEAILITQYVADFFVNQARLSGHRFSSKEDEDAALIYHHNPVFCDPDITHFEQCYIF